MRLLRRSPITKEVNCTPATPQSIAIERKEHYMRRVIVTLTFAALVLGLFAAPASAAPPADVDAAPNTIYPYVNGGRTDSALLTWFADGAVDIYVDGNFIASRGSDVSTFSWNGRQGVSNIAPPTHPGNNSNNLGDFNAGASSQTYQLCVVEKDSAFGDLLGDCDSVTVRRVYEVTATNEREAQRGRKGRSANKIISAGCAVKRGKIGLRVNCNPGHARALYRIGPAPLGPGEFVVSTDRFVRYWDGGDTSTHADALISNNRRVRVRLLNGFLGQVRRVRILWDIDAPDVIRQH